jgi:cation diffusion facilitator CzcD-associated flavoprotein CzcO
MHGTTWNERFDTVAVCSGHFWKPFVPEIRGMENFKGLCMHSREFRRKEEFTGKVKVPLRVKELGTKVQPQSVLVIGGSFSGVDIAHSLQDVATVTMSVRNDCQVPPQYTQGVSSRPEIDHVSEDGRFHFVDGTHLQVDVDIVLYATGFLFDYPFLDENSGLPPKGFPLTLHDQGHAVSHLYQQCFYFPNPTLAFVGLPIRITPFPLSQYQASALAKFWARKIDLPPPQQLEQIERQRQQEVLSKGISQRKLHYLGKDEFKYCNQLAEWAGDKPYVRWRMEMRQIASELRFKEAGFSALDI